MTASITTTTDVANARVGVTLSGFSLPDGPVIVYRSTGAAAAEVRQQSDLSGGAGFVWDYEAPFGVPLTYRVTDADASVISSSSTTLEVTKFWLRAPGLPDYDVIIDVTTKPVTSTTRANAALNVLGRANPVVLSTARSSSTFTLAVHTQTSGEATSLQALLDASPTCLLVMPGTPTAWQYVFISDSTATPLVPWKSLSDGDAGSQYDWTLSCTVVDRPVGGMFGDSSDDYALVLATWPTYAAMQADEPTYLDLLQNVGT